MALDILNQDEIDALLNGVDSGTVDLVAPIQPGEVRAYDFATQTRIVRGRMPTLEMINERFARQMRLSMFNMLATHLPPPTLYPPAQWPARPSPATPDR